ncbi:MBOAT family protein [uncultured Ruthenibacterium sp.]|uniref:MBOAT family O-acyltransferase n=1 Tax=uncultured Ruthenibacterium sp. TaxID=1905347 RepID=UPI00349EDE2D
MQFNSIDFLIYFPIVTLLYFILPQKIKWIWLLICSVYFYMCWKAKYIILIGFSIIVTYLGALLIERLRKRSNWLARAVLTLVLLSNFAVLFLFKYYGFFSGLITEISQNAIALPIIQFALPVGISFYTFQALGYAIDVYRGDLAAEKNLFRYALFVCFFPQLVAGPIERATNLLPQFYERHTFDYDRMKRGLILMGWGFFQKIVIADRMAVLVDGAYEAYSTTPGSVLALATLFFSFQIYCDFASYSNIAIGAAEIMGFRLMKNFNAPYLSQSIKEFWRRWHISLSTWFKDYLYIPLGGSRKGTFRTCINILVVFLVSGLWHGAAMTFVIWGALHGFFQVIQTIWNKLNAKRLSAGRRFLPPWIAQIATFLLVNLTWIFFRASSLEQAQTILKRIFTQWNGSLLTLDTLETLGLDTPDLIVGILAIAILIAIDILSQKHDLRAGIMKLALPVQWLLYLGLIIAIVVFGVYGPQYETAPFIYFQF